MAANKHEDHEGMQKYLKERGYTSKDGHNRSIHTHPSGHSVDLHHDGGFTSWKKGKHYTGHGFDDLEKEVGGSSQHSEEPGHVTPERANELVAQTQGGWLRK